VFTDTGIGGCVVREYKTTSTVEIFSGLIGLSNVQADKRIKKLKKKKTGVYEILLPVQFKAGERIKLDKPEKVLLSKLEKVE
jgi:hypothetical protein